MVAEEAWIGLCRQVLESFIVGFVWYRLVFVFGFLVAASVQ